MRNNDVTGGGRLMYCLSWLFPLAGDQGSPDKAQIPEPTGLQLVTSITHGA